MALQNQRWTVGISNVPMIVAAVADARISRKSAGKEGPESTVGG